MQRVGQSGRAERQRVAYERRASKGRAATFLSHSKWSGRLRPQHDTQNGTPIAPLQTYIHQGCLGPLLVPMRRSDKIRENGNLGPDPSSGIGIISLRFKRRTSFALRWQQCSARRCCAGPLFDGAGTASFFSILARFSPVFLLFETSSIDANPTASF